MVTYWSYGAVVGAVAPAVPPFNSYVIVYEFGIQCAINVTVP